LEKKPGVFIREATGLVREFSWFDAFAITWNATIVFSLFIVTPAVGLFPGTNPMIALVLLFVLAMFYAVNFGWLAMAMPRSGGPYVYNTRVLHPAVGFMGEFLLAINYILSGAVIFNILISWTLSWFLSSLGFAEAASMVTQPSVLFALASIVVIIAVLLNLFPKSLSWFFRATIALSLVGAAVLLPAMLSGFGRFPELFTKATGVDYNSIIPLAMQNGFGTGHNWTSTMLTLAWLGPFWLGFGGVYIAGEVKNVRKSMLWGTVGANITFNICYIVFVGSIYLVSGYTWYNALSWLYDKGGTAYPLAFDPSIQNMAAIMVPYPWVGPVVAFTMLASMSALIPVFHLWISRGTFMWAFDRLLPEKYTEVSERLHTPIIALVATSIVLEIALAISIFSGLFSVWLNAAWLGAVGILITSVSGMLLPYVSKTKKIYESAPAIVRTKVAGVPLITIGGTGTFLFMAIFFVTAAMNPSVNPLGESQMLSIPILCIIGLAYFYLAKYYRQRQGIDLSIAYKELPPE